MEYSQQAIIAAYYRAVTAMDDLGRVIAKAPKVDEFIETMGFCQARAKRVMDTYKADVEAAQTEMTAPLEDEK